MDRLVSLGRGLAGLGELYWSPAGVLWERINVRTGSWSPTSS